MQEALASLHVDRACACIHVHMAGAATSQFLIGTVAVQDMVLEIQHQTLQEAVKAHPNLSDAIILLKVAPLSPTQLTNHSSIL